MINIEELHQMWKADSHIDGNQLDEASRKGANLHSKYLELYDVARLTHRRQEMDLSEMRQKKKRYYSGKMSKKEMDEEGWDYDPFQGESKPLKSELGPYIDSDPDVQRLTLKVEYSKVVVDALKEIIDTIRWRHQTIRNMISWRQFEAGV
jgi:hypothetical protein